MGLFLSLNSQAMEICPSVLLPLLLLVILSPAATPSALSPGANDEVYIVFVSRADYLDSPDYDVRLLASVLGSTEKARAAMVYHYGGLGFAARLQPDQADRLSKKEGVAVLKDKAYHVEKDGRLPRFFEENI